jgi:toxin ParE1/3/4
VGEDYKVIFGPRSRTDLQGIVEHICRASRAPEVAERFGNQLIQKALTLSRFPERGRVVPELKLEEVREIIFRDYRIAYRLTTDHVQILRFWHAARGAPEISVDDFTS